MSVSVTRKLMPAPLPSSLLRARRAPLRSARDRRQMSGVDVQDVARRLRPHLRGEERDGLGDVLRIHALLQQAALPVELLDLVLRDLVAGGALGAPRSAPDARTLDHRIGIDDVDADLMRRALDGEAA